MTEEQTKRIPGHFAKWRDWYIFGVIAGMGAAYFWWPYTPTVFRDIDKSSSAYKYLAEFQHYNYPEVSVLAPNGRLKIQETLGPGGLSLFNNCHTFWIEFPDGTRRMIVRADEDEPGSGRGFFLGWSKDSKAIFISGRYGKLDCRGASGTFNTIYTVDDDILWAVQ